MVTTVTVDEETHRKLKNLKDEMKAFSLDEVVDRLIEKELEVPSTEEMFGSTEIKEMDKVRDRNDRADRYE